jgi:hypothetical protein
MVAVAHPDAKSVSVASVDAGKEITRIVDGKFRVAVFASGGFVHLPAQLKGHQLEAIADAEDGDAEVPDFGGGDGSTGFVGAMGTPGEDDAFRVKRSDLFCRHRKGVEFREHPEFADASGDQLRILGAVVEDENQFRMLHS